MRSNVRRSSSPQHRQIESVYSVTDYRGERAVGYYLSMLRRRESSRILFIYAMEASFSVHWRHPDSRVTNQLLKNPGGRWYPLPEQNILLQEPQHPPSSSSIFVSQRQTGLSQQRQNCFQREDLPTPYLNQTILLNIIFFIVFFVCLTSVCSK